MHTDAYLVYMRATPLGEVISARVEIYDGSSWNIIDAVSMTEAWMSYCTPADALVRLKELGLTLALNAPSEKDVQLPLDGF